MKRKVIETRNFSKSIDDLIKKRQLLREDYDRLKNELTANPDVGDFIVGTGGVRKVRLKAPSKGKGGGFRICYYYKTANERIYLIQIYGKNEKENLTMTEKKLLKEFVQFLKGAYHE